MTKLLAVAGIIGLIIGVAGYVFIRLQARTESWQKNKWERNHAHLNIADLDAARKSEYDRRIFPGCSNKILFSSIIVVLLVFVVAELGLLRPS
ncbi:MAG: hypothetical protein Q8M20_17020 [Rhodocyclaceae bacterium]|nr:hypothetical protein [Rhodocyclaceae bacterium]MDZ4213896.1 hypothetical protein [Rhodocyclaceae bacterium]